MTEVCHCEAAIKLWGDAGKHAQATYQRFLPLYPGPAGYDAVQPILVPSC